MASEIDLSDFDEVPPSISMIESIRSFGYSFNTAVADLIDNSISAFSSKVNIHMEWGNGDPFIAILDDGEGMNEEAISKNVVLGSKHPREKREKHDLGRFGFGLKTASFSMARELHVFSKTEKDQLCYRAWDLDILEQKNKWLISKKLPAWYDSLDKKLKIGERGTLVLWKNCDRLLKNSANAKAFKDMGIDLISYLGTIFCRYIAPPNKLNIYVNSDNIPVEPWDPIPPGSRSLEKQELRGIKVTPYILPHQSTFENPDDYKKAGGINGWNQQQGFYVYRNKRLIVNGGWLGLKRMKVEEHINKARILVDIDTDFDEVWQIDVLKSRATIPSGDIKNSLEAIAKHVRKQADEAYRDRGKVLSRTTASPDIFLWQMKKRSDQSKEFVINRNHPYVKLIKENYAGKKTDIDRLLGLIEKLLPTEVIQVETAKETIEQSEIPYETVKEMTEGALIQTNELMSKKKILENLTYHEPWRSYKEELIKEFL